MSRAVITLLTDFGTADGYVGEMKGVLLTGAPAATLVDVAHDLPPQDVFFARLVVGRYWERYRARTVHLVVVDPGVGSARAAIAVESGGRFLVGPDNGVLSAAVERPGSRAVSLPVGADAAPTFHGRDVFAPAAARLASGEPLDVLGEPVSPVVLPIPECRREGDRWVGEVIAIDRFGNAITNLPREASRILAGGRELRVVRTYADLDVGEAGALVGSSGRIEIAVRTGSAARDLGLKTGAGVSGTR